MPCGHHHAALSDLQYDPVALLGSALHGGLGHRLLALAQGHVVQLAQVDGEAQLPAWGPRVEDSGGEGQRTVEGSGGEQ